MKCGRNLTKEAKFFPSDKQYSNTQMILVKILLLV